MTETTPPAEIVHGCPPDGSGLTPCCGRTPFELPGTDRMSTDPALVTCRPAATVPASAPTDQAALRSDLEDALKGAGIYDSRERMWHSLSPEWIEEILTEVLAVLPASTDQADATEAYRLALSQALGLGTGANWEALRDRSRDLAAEVAELTRAVRRPGGREQAPADQAALPVRPQTLAAIARHLEARAVTILRPDSETYAEYHAVAAELRRLADAASGPGRADGETQQDQTQARRGDLFEAWLKTQRDQHDSDGTGDHEMYDALDNLLDEYRLYADTGTPLREHVCEARAVGDCDCLEQPAAVSQPGKEA